MCGIAGYIGSKNIDQSKIESCLRLMENRGPNGQFSKKIKCNENLHLDLLHARLSILDLDPRSNQPYTIGSKTLIYNGEIYNYKEIREDLKALGHQFITTSDTEVLLKAYIQYGDSCVEHFNGMWAFAIYDNETKKLFLSRDRFAEKPFYYLKNDDGFYFGSEIKFIANLLGENLKINYNHIYKNLIYGYTSLYKSNEHYFKGLKEIESGTNGYIDQDLNLSFSKYWQPKIDINPDMSMSEAIKGTRERLLRSVELRLRADVPLAFCLSGGVDSAGLASIASKEFGHQVASFSIIDGDNRYNEYDNIMATINDINCDHHLVNLKFDNTLPQLKELIQYHDAPIPVISYYIHSLLSKNISKHGYKVSISGTSADELFTGYYDHFNMHLWEMRNHNDYKQYLSDWHTYTGQYLRNPHLKNPELFFEDQNFNGHKYLNLEEFQQFLRVPYETSLEDRSFTKPLLRNRMLNELFHEVTPLILHEDDLNSMKYSIENRSPYLDPDLFEFAYSIPNEHLIKDGYAKYVLREALGGILNDKVRLDRVKKGFNASINSILDLECNEVQSYLLDDSPIFEHMKREKVKQLLQQKEYSNSMKKFLFSFINTKIFIEQFG